MDNRNESLPFGGDPCWDAFVDPSVQQVLVPWRELIANHASGKGRSWLCPFPVVAYSVVRSRVDGEKIPRWPYDTLYELVPELTSELFARTTAYFQAPPQAWDLDRLITTYSGEFVGHVGGSGPWEFRLLSHGEVAMRIAKQSQKFGHLTKDHIRKRYAEIKRAQQALRRKWAGAISWMPGFALDSNGGWLKLHEAGLREFIEQHGAKLNKP